MAARRQSQGDLLKLVTVELRAHKPAFDYLLDNPAEAGRSACDLIGRKDREHFLTFHLDSQYRASSYELTSIGTLDASLVQPREVYKAAMLANSSAIVCAHNHPSGSLKPSQPDFAIYKRLKNSGKLLGVELLDFLIVHGDNYQAFSTRPDLTS